MTHPTHGLDPNALEAAESAYAAATMDLPRHECENCGGSGVIITGRARGEHADANTCQACGGGGVVIDFPEGWNPMASAITAYLAALSQNPGTSNTSGEAGPVAWRFKADDPHYDDAYVYCATEEMALLRCPKNSKVEPLYAALEPRASDREAVIEEIENAMLWFAHPLTDRKVLRFKAEQTAAAIRKLSEVSHV
jgi:hypothetical protein